MDKITKQSPTKSALQYGILFGVIMILELVVMYVIGMQSMADTSAGTIMNIVNYVILPALFIYLSCIDYKKANQGFISFGECIKTGVKITFLAALIYAVFYVIFNLIFPDFTDQLLAITKSEMIKKSPDMPQEQMDAALSMTQKFMKPYIIAPFTLVIFSIIGLIHSLIIGAIVKKDRPQSF